MNFRIILSGFIPVCLLSCSPSTQEAEDHHDEDHDHNKGEIVVEPDDAARFGVATAKVGHGSIGGVIHVSGQIEAGSDGAATATAPTSGIVTLKPSALASASVAAGQTIATVAAQNMSGGDVNKAARAAVDAARREVERLRPLLEEGIATRREYDAAVANLAAAQAAYSPAAASGTVAASRAGVITNVYVSTGQFVEAGAPIADISTGQGWRLRVDLPESQRNVLGRIVGCNLRELGGDGWIAGDSIGVQIENVNPSTPSQAGYIPVYITLPRADGLSVGSFIDVALLLDNPAATIAVPNTALAEQQGAYFVYVLKSEHGYEKRKVEVGLTDGLSTQILSGLAEGEEIVVEGTTMVRIAESSGAVPEGHSHHH